MGATGRLFWACPVPWDEGSDSEYLTECPLCTQRVKTPWSHQSRKPRSLEIGKVSGVSWPCLLVRQQESSPSSGTHSLRGLLLVRDSPEFWLMKCDHIQTLGESVCHP